jgi:uncharacterized protein (TIGR02302 family)
MAFVGGSEKDPVIRKLRLPLALTQLGMVAERVLRSFWPLLTVILLVLAALMLGLHDLLPVEVVWAGAVAAFLGASGSLIYGARSLQLPSRTEALARLDASLPGRPIQALMDEQAIGLGDEASAAVWRAHQARMAARMDGARPVKPDMRIAARDPFAIRYVALLAFSVALIFGSVLRIGSVADMAPSSAQAATGPSWEGWAEPPRYTGKPTIYLADVAGDTLRLPEGTRITLRFYGELGALTLAETVSGRTGDVPSASDPVQDFVLTQEGELRIDGPGGQSWTVEMIGDTAPDITVSGLAEAGALGEMTLPFTASDDYGVELGQAVIALDPGAVDRRLGLAVEPEPREAVTVPLPMPITGDRAEFTENLIEDFSKHPWANLPVTITLSATDAAGNETVADPFATNLPARRFFDPLAASVAEQRRDLLWSRENATRVAQVLRAVSNRPDDVFRSETAYLRLRVILRRLETQTRIGLSHEMQEEIADALWDLAILLEEGDLSDALERMRRAQERLSEAMRNGASDQEIAELMQELREATNEYMRQLSRQAQQDGQQQGEQGQQQSQNQMQMTQDDLQAMMDRIQELMEQGRMAEAQQALEEFQRMMENMRVTQGQQGGGQSEGQQAMEGLAETLREQQGLSDQAFRDLQEQFNPNAQAGESQGNEGRDGGQGRGSQHDGQQPGEGQGQGQGEGNQQAGREGQQGEGGEGSLEENLAERQRSLRNELRRQQDNLPVEGTPEGEAARDSLDRAGRAMEGAEEALRQDDLAEAIDRQSEAMEALREGIRSLGEALAQDQQNQSGQGTQGAEAEGRDLDPLGRDRSSGGLNENRLGLNPGEDIYGRARDLLDEIRRRSGESDRPDIELDYLKRLLDRF